MRVFIAIDINDQIRNGIGNLQQKLSAEADIKKSDVKWVRPESIHLTLKFLGEIKDAQCVEVCNITEEVVANHKNFELDIESVGCFGGKSPRVLWVGMGAGSNQLRELAKNLDEKFTSAGWPEETRDFTGHLTVCRIRNSRAGVKLAKLAQNYEDAKLGDISVDSITVYQSQLKPAGAIYTVLGKYNLK